jgi:hypothetical protein
MTTNDWILLALPVAAAIVAILATKLGSWLSPSREGSGDAVEKVARETADQIGRGVLAVMRHDREKHTQQMNILARSLIRLREDISTVVNQALSRNRERA